MIQTIKKIKHINEMKVGYLYSFFKKSESKTPWESISCVYEKSDIKIRLTDITTKNCAIESEWTMDKNYLKELLDVYEIGPKENHPEYFI